MCAGTELDPWPFDATAFTDIPYTNSHSYASLGSHFSDGAGPKPFCNTTPGAASLRGEGSCLGSILWAVSVLLMNSDIKHT